MGESESCLVLSDAAGCWVCAMSLLQDGCTHAVALTWPCLEALVCDSKGSDAMKWERGRVGTVSRGPLEDMGWNKAGDGARPPHHQLVPPRRLYTPCRCSYSLWLQGQRGVPHCTLPTSAPPGSKSTRLAFAGSYRQELGHWHARESQTELDEALRYHLAQEWQDYGMLDTTPPLAPTAGMASQSPHFPLSLDMLCPCSTCASAQPFLIA